MHSGTDKCRDLEEAGSPTASSSDAPGLKWKNTWAASLFVFVSPVSSAMIAPALQNLGESLCMHSDIEVYLSLAIFILAYAVGPIFFGPVSELYSRMRLLQVTNPQFFAFRFLAGICGSAPLAIGGGDIWWEAMHQGSIGTANQASTYANSFVSLQRLVMAMGICTLGPVLGPVVGPIAGGFMAQYFTWSWDFEAAQSVFTKPVIFCMAIYMAYLSGTTYFIFATFPEIWTMVYHEEPGISGLVFNLVQDPQDFTTITSVSTSFACPPWPWALTYIVDSYQTYAASAMAACAILRSPAGFGFPLFAPYIVGFGWMAHVIFWHYGPKLRVMSKCAAD
ncbi:hypothetical protein BDW75DRAFT_234348 [Aspergillus navahoensis]